MQLHLTDTGRIATQGHRKFYRVETPRGHRLADFTTAAEAQALVASLYGKYEQDCRVCQMVIN